MKIHVFYSVYGQPQFFEKSLKSIIDYVDGVVVVYGPYKGFPHEFFNGGLEEYAEICRRHNVKLYVYDPMTQTEKRSLAFKLIPEDDMIFILDDDEVCVGDVKKGINYARNVREEFGYVFVEDESWSCYRIRFIRCDRRLRYGPTHWIISRDNQIVSDTVSCSEPTFTITQFKIVNMKDEYKDNEYNVRFRKYHEYIRERNYHE